MQLSRGSTSHRNSHQGGSSNWERRRLDSKDLPSVRRLGEGLSGFLYETTWNGSKYVRKDFPLGSVHYNVFEKEAIALLDLEHPNIVMCSHYTVGNSGCSLLLQYVDDDLQNFIQKRIDAQGKGNRTGSSTTLHSRVLDIDETRIFMSSKAKGREMAGADVDFMKMPENELTVPFALPEALDIILQIATGVEYLHDNRIVHGDLKPKNVLVGYGGIVKLVDFGLLETKKRIKLVSKHTRHFEILIWKAPELFTKLLGPVIEDSDDPFTDSDTDEDEEIESSFIFTKSRLAMADVYSFGLICSQILGGNLMYSNLSLTQLREQRMHGFRPQLPSTCPNDLQFLIFSSVERDPWCRPTFTDICTALKAFQSNQLPLLMEGVERTNALAEDADQDLTEMPKDMAQIKNSKNLTGMDMEKATQVVLEKSGLLGPRDELPSNLKIDSTAIKIEEPVRPVVPNSKRDEADEVFSGNPNDLPRHQQPATEFDDLKKLEVKVRCSRERAKKLEAKVRRMNGVFAVKADWVNSRVTILESLGGGIDHHRLLRMLKKDFDSEAEIVGHPNPSFGPEPASSAASSNSPFIVNHCRDSCHANAGGILRQN